MSVEQADTQDYREFKTRVLRRTGIDLGQYKQLQMHRRLWNLVEKSRAPSFMAYYELLESDGRELSAFLDRITINVSEFFRNPEKWEHLRNRVLPTLLSNPDSLRFWCAGCSYGAEPYSLAMLLAQDAPDREYVLVASDIDKRMLTKANQGLYPVQDLRNLEPELLSRFFTGVEDDVRRAPNEIPQPHSVYRVSSEIRERITFQEHNLLADEFEGNLNLICCRNVVIYFTEAAKVRLFQNFYDALAPGGVLFLGATERIFQYREIGFQWLESGFYRRPRLGKELPRKRV